jgi:hypothetical protein
MEVSSDTKADGDGPAAVELPCWDSAEVDPDADFKGVTAVFGYGSLVRPPFSLDLQMEVPWCCIQLSPLAVTWGHIPQPHPHS